MINVLIVDDSLIAVHFLSGILTSDPEINIIGSALNGEDAVSMIRTLKPDVVTMDITMPGIDGFETTRRIMETNPVPIIIVSSSYRAENVNLSIRAMEAGALAIIAKPAGIKNPDYEKDKDEFNKIVRQMSEIKVPVKKTAGSLKNYEKVDIPVNGIIDIIAIGASTGGPQALQKFLKSLNGEIKQPMLIVQHMASGFTAGFAEWLASTCSLNVRIPENGEKISGDTVYVAPDGLHMGVGQEEKILLSDSALIKNLRPAVSFMFRTVAELYGPRAIGVLLTGMGRDGADELRLMRDRGAVTFAQDEASSIVFGMPGEAIKMGGAVFILPPEEIANKIIDMLRVK